MTWADGIRRTGRTSSTTSPPTPPPQGCGTASTPSAGCARSPPSSSQRRRQWIEEAVARGQVEIINGTGYRARRHPCPGFAEVTRADGTTGPWRNGITLDELDVELRMVRAACYVFIVALSAMRDSEIQEIERDAVATFFGSPAVTSRKVKNDPARSHQHWWIIDPVAEAIAVAERLSWHPTHVFASIVPPKTAGGQATARAPRDQRGLRLRLLHRADQHHLWAAGP
ncbi:hypothetical protein GCM10027074_75550 [Streptomyces deserti]